MNPILRNLLRDASRPLRRRRLGDATATMQRVLGKLAEGAFADRLIDTPGIDPEFRAGSHTHVGLTRQYKLYVPPDARDHALPLLVMLHGCTQSPDDFARGTGMNELASARGFCVLYPAQSAQANASRCWNWFKHNHQQRGRGEPALIAATTRQVMQSPEFDVDPRRVYIAGLSAGGAMAAIVGAAYPDLFAAVGVHSGLAPGAAGNLSEALAAMKGTSTDRQGHASSARQPPLLQTRLPLPVIVFHGDADATVNTINGDQVIAAAIDAADMAGDELSSNRRAAGPRIEHGQSAGGRRFTRSLYGAESGRPSVAEHWVLHGAGHAWSGGRAAGSYTDPLGPDASREMLRFFLEHPGRPPGETSDDRPTC